MRLMDLECQSCKFIFEEMCDPGQKLPCPECGQEAVQVWVQAPHKRFFSKFVDNGDYLPKVQETGALARQQEKEGKYQRKKAYSYRGQKNGRK